MACVAWDCCASVSHSCPPVVKVSKVEIICGQVVYKPLSLVRRIAGAALLSSFTFDGGKPMTLIKKSEMLLEVDGDDPDTLQADLRAAVAIAESASLSCGGGVLVTQHDYWSFTVAV